MRSGNAVSLTANLGFLILIAVGTAVIAFRGAEESGEAVATSPSVVAIKSLPANHQLQASDLRIDGIASGKAAARAEAEAEAMAELVGRYLTAPVKASKPVGDVAASPRLQLDGGAIILGLAVSREDVAAGRIDAGTETLACSGRREASRRSFVVEAVQCPAESGDCLGFVRLTPAERQEPALFEPGLAPRLSAVACDSPVPAPAPAPAPVADKPDKPSE